MKNTLIQNISRYISLSEEEAHIIEKFWIERSFEKGEYLLRNGETCRYDTYVVSGSVKTYLINYKTGEEEILFFAIDDWWATDIESFSKQKPSMYNIQAIEDTKVLQISYTSFQQLLATLPRLERYFRLILESYLGALQKRIIYHNAFDAESRYYDFLVTYPEIAKKVPQYLIASYLGVSAEFISRIRRKNKSS